MAATEAGRRLTQAHRLLQARNAAVIAQLVERLWRQMMSPSQPMEQVGTWLAAVMPLVLEHRLQSRDYALAYYSQFREFEAPDAAAAPEVPPESIEEVSAALRTSLTVVGPLALVRSLEAGIDEADAFTLSGDKVVSAAVRHTANGGRRAIHESVRRDRASLGWMRVTADRPCFFCAMLASRGPVYKGDSFDDSDPRFVDHPDRASDVKVHDSCMCSLEPVMSRESAMYENHREFQQLWYASTKGKSGHEMVLAFRRAYETVYGGG